MTNLRYLCLLAVLATAPGCTFLQASGEAAGVVGKAAWEGAKAVGNLVYTGTSMTGQTANQANRSIMRDTPPDKTTTLSMDHDRIVVPLEREGTSYYVHLKLNGNVSARFLLDTGASAMQVSGAMARKLNLRAERGKTVPVMLAGGGYVRGRIVEIPEVAIGEARLHRVKAIVLEKDDMGVSDGLLGMTFLENFVFSIDAQKGELVLERRHQES